MRTKEEIRAEIRIVECGGRHKVQTLKTRPLRKPVWRDMYKVGSFFGDTQLAIYDSLSKATAVIDEYVDTAFAAQPEAWRPVKTEGM